MNDKSNPAPRKRGPSLKWANLSVRFKLVTIILVAVLVSVAAVAALNIYNTGRELTKNTGASLTELARAAGHDVAALLVDRVTGMQSLAAEGEFQDDMAEQNAAYSGGTDSILAELTALDKQWIAAADDDPLVKARLGSTFAYELEEVKDLIPDFVEVFVTDRYGGLAATSDRTSDYYQADEEWWQAAYNNGQGAVYIAPPAVDESTGVTSINIAVPVYAENGQVIGILRATLDVATLLNRLGNIQVGETGRADMIIGDTLFDIHHEEHTGEVEKELDAAALAEIKSSSAGFLQTPFAGQPSLVGYASISSLSGEEYITDLDWYTILYQTESEALAAVGQQARTSLIIAAIVATLAILVGVGMGQLIANPIALLRDMVVQFTTGNLDARVDIQSEDEIGTLATNFNQMAEQVGGLLQEVQDRSAALEERSRELEASQRVTFAASEHATPDELLDLVVNLIRDQFDLYHAQVYMVDEVQNAAVLRQSTGYAGRQLLQRKHRIALDATALVTRAIHTGEPVLVDDVQADSTFLANPLLPDTRAELVVPLKREGKVIGVLDAQDRTAGRFNPSTIALFQTMTDQVAILFENSELLQRVTDQTEVLSIFTTQLRTAADIARRLGTILDPEQLLQEVVELIQSRFGLYHAHIYLLDEETNVLKLATGSGEVGRVLRERAHSIPMDAEKSLVARAARSSSTLLVADTALEADFMPNPLLPQTRSELSLPLVVGNTLLGVLDLQDDQAGRFTEAERDTFGTLAGLVATAIQNARLFERQRESERVIQQSEAQQRLILESSPTPTLVTTFDGRILYANPQVGELFGMAPDDFIQHGVAALYYDLADRQEFLKVMEREGHARNFEIRFKKADGTSIWGLLNTEPITYAGEPAMLNGIYDITERRQAEAAIRESRQMLQIVMDNLPESIFWKDKDLVYLGCNTNFAHDAGVDSPEQVIGKTDHDMPWKDQVALYQADDRHVIDTGESKIDYEEPQSTPDGSTIWLRTSKLPLYNEQGEAYAVLGAYADITEMKKAQAEIEKRASELQTVAEVGTAASTILEPDRLLGRVVELTKANFGLYHAHIYLIDEAGESLVLAAGAGEAGQQMLAQGWQIAADSATSLVARAFRTREGVIVNDVRAAPDFLPNPLLPDTRSELAVPLIVGEQVLGVLDVQSDQVDHFTQQDVTIQTTLAGQIATAIENARLFQETRQIDRLKSEFLANMSHELRTPLNSIIGYVQLLLMDLEGEIPEDSYEDMKSVETNSQHLLNLINDVLDLARIEAGRMELHKENIDVPNLLDSVKSNNAGLFIDSPLTFSVEADPDLPQIHADQIRITQVLNNLVSNAYKFTETGGVIMRAYSVDNEVCIAIEDTGIGIAEKDLDTVFERFRQVDGSFTRRAEGTGLGLSITRLLVELHGGRLTVHSKLGEGSTFIVHLPVAA